MNQCALCKDQTVATILDFGPQPICNRFLTAADREEFSHPLTLGYCPSCDLAQLINPVPAQELLPAYDWISYNEPEAHLDQMVALLAGLPGLTAASTVAGVSFKDDSTLARLERLGFPKSWRLEQGCDLGITAVGAGVETVQRFLVPETAQRVASTKGRADLLIVRHILEHAHDLNAFMSSLKELAAPQGYIVIEVPDCARALANHDITTVWEEHPIYFTPNSLRRVIEDSGFRVLEFLSYPYAFENSLVAVVQADGVVQVGSVVQAEGGAQTPAGASEGQQIMQAYGAAFPKVRQAMQAFLKDFNQHRGPVALFGAGHLACTYVNLLGIGSQLRCVVDDNPHKQGLSLPGSRLPVLGSRALLDQGIRLCLLSLSPEVEDKVIEKNRAFVESGGIFASIFPESRHALRLP
jgi:hypothetical protein